MSAWVEQAIGIFNYPNGMGESWQDALVELEEQLTAPPKEATATELQWVRGLADEVRVGLGVEHGGKRPAPYTEARLREGGMDLWHGGRCAWVAFEERDRLRPFATGKGDASEQIQLWKTFDPGPPDVERRFAEHQGRGRGLHIIAQDLMDAGEHDLVLVIAAEVFREGPRHPQIWWSRASAQEGL